MRKIAVIGEQCAGKTTLTNLIAKVGGTHVHNIKFADPIYGALGVLGREKHRLFMQDFGDLSKKHFGELVFVNAFQQTFERMRKEHGWNAGLILTCDDVRRTYEFSMVKGLGFTTVFIDTPSHVRESRARKLGLHFATSHNSETEVASLKQYCDHVLDGTKSEYFVEDFVRSTLLDRPKIEPGISAEAQDITDQLEI